MAFSRDRRAAVVGDLPPGLGCAAGVILAGVVLSGCAPSDAETDFLARKALLSRQNQGIRELIAEAEQGSLVPRDRFLVGLDEKILGDIFRTQLPLERPLGEKFVIRLEKAEISLRDKYGVVVIEGSVHRRATPDREVAARIYGGLGDVSIDADDGQLNIEITIDQIVFLKAGIMENVIDSAGKTFFAAKGREMLQEAIPRLQVPVVLGRDIRIPPLEEGGIRLDALTVPLNLSVERVIAAGGKLWVTVHAEVGALAGGEAGLGVQVGKAVRP